MARMMSKLKEKNRMGVSIQRKQRVKTVKELTEALGQIDSNTKQIPIFKHQIKIYTIGAVWKEKKDNAKFSEKADAHFSGLENLKNRLNALLLILPTRTFPAYEQVGPSSADDILEDDAEQSGFTLMDDFKEHGASIMAASTDRVLKLQEKNATYLHMDLVFGWDQVDVFKWCQPLTDVQAGYKVGRVFVDLETDEELVVRGLHYDDANDDVVLYLHLVNDLTAGDIDKSVMNPRGTVSSDLYMFRQQQIAGKWRVKWTGRVFKTTAIGVF